MLPRLANKRAPRYTQAGLGLIEILVAVLVLSIGILGVAALQTRALVGSGNSIGRSMATVATYSIVDALITDRDNALTSDYNTTVVGNACPAGTSLVKTQLHDWCESLARNLGAADTTKGTVACDANGNCKVTIEWNDTRTRSDAGGGIQMLVTWAQI